MKKKSQSQLSDKLKKSLSLALVVVLATTLFIPLNIQLAFATPTSAEKQAEADEVSAKLQAAEAEMLQMRDDYMAAVEAHDAAIVAMEEAQTRINAAQAIIQETQGRLGSRATQMYRSGPLSFLNVLFGASSFEEFTTSWDLLNVINQENASLIQVNKDARAEAQAAHEEFTAQEEAAAERLAESDAIKVKAEELVAMRQAELAGLEAEVATLVEQEEKERLDKIARETPIPVPDPGIEYTPPPPPQEGGYASVVDAAVSRLGCPYVWGATGPNSFDCSGLTSWCYSQAGLGYITRTDASQYAAASARWPFSSGGAAPGDVLWWPGHVAIFVGGTSYIHAPQPGQVVCYSTWNINAATVLRF